MADQDFMQIYLTQLVPEWLWRSPEPGPVQQSAWQPLLVEKDRTPWVPPPAQGLWPGFLDRDSLPFPSRQHNAALDSIQGFYNQKRCDMRLNGATGLPQFLYGDLYPERGEADNLDAAAAFLKLNQLVLAGRDRPTSQEAEEKPAGAGIRLGAVKRIVWPDGADHIRFQQFGPLGGAIYGAQVVTTFDATGKLMIASSSLYPAFEELPSVDGELIPRWAAEFAAGTSPFADALGQQVPEHIGFRRLVGRGIFPWIYPQHRYSSVADNPKLCIILLGQAWTYDPEARQWRFDLEAWSERAGREIGGRYVRAAETWFEDDRGAHWHAILDITDLEQPVLIDFDLAERAAPFLCFPNAATARDYFAAVAQPGVNLAALVAALGLQTELDFGGGNSFRNADSVKCAGYVDPAVPPVLSDPDTFRVPTVFFQLRQAQNTFGLLLNEAAVSALTPPAGIVNPLNEIHVEFTEEHDTSVYRPDGTIVIRRGFSTGGLTAADSGLDPEVIVHEFAHAVIHYYFDGVFHYAPNDRTIQRSVKGLDESQAFYLSSAVFGDAQWSEYAYAAWQMSRDLATPASGFQYPASLQDPFGPEHGLGIWLGRLYWLIRSQEAVGRSMNVLLLKALSALAPLGLSNQTPQASREAQFKSILSLIAAAIYAQSDSVAQRAFMLQIFSGAGLSVP